MTPDHNAMDGQRSTDLVARDDQASLFDIVDTTRAYKVVAIAVLVLLALLSFFVMGTLASSPETYAKTTAALDEKRDTVMGLVTASTAASAGISLLPGDAGTPIAEKLVDLSADFLIVIAAIYLEKYLLTIMGFAAFKILVPVACLLLVGAILLVRQEHTRRKFARLAAKLALLGIALFVAVPASIMVSNMVDQTYQASISETVEAANQTASSAQEEAAASSNAASSADTAVAPGTSGASESDSGGFSLLGFIQDIPESVSSGVSDLGEKVSGGVASLTAQAQESMNNFIEALAVMIVTSCIIPILVLVFFLWLVKVILGAGTEVPMQMLKPQSFRGLRK